MDLARTSPNFNSSGGRPNHGPRKFLRRDRPGRPPNIGSLSGPRRSGPPRHPHRRVLLHPALGPLVVEYRDPALGYSPGDNPGGPCGRHNGSPVPALYRHCIQGLRGGAVPLHGAHVGGRHDRPPRMGRHPPHTWGPAGAADVLPWDPAGRCPGPKNLARVNIAPRAPAITHSGSCGPPRGPRVGDAYPGATGGGAGRSHGDSGLPGSSLYGNGHLPPGHPPSTPKPARDPGGDLEAAPPPGALPGRGHDSAYGKAPE